MSKKTNINYTMENKSINFYQSGEIHFNGKNWKSVVRTIPSTAKILLVFGVKGNMEIPICINKSKDFRKSVKTTYLNKRITTWDGKVIDRKTSLLSLMEQNDYSVIKIQWGNNFIQTVEPIVLSKINRAA
jgi:hypothetical protein